MCYFFVSLNRPSAILAWPGAVLFRFRALISVISNTIVYLLFPVKMLLWKSAIVLPQHFGEVTELEVEGVYGHFLQMVKCHTQKIKQIHFKTAHYTVNLKIRWPVQGIHYLLYCASRDRLFVQYIHYPYSAHVQTTSALSL